MPLGQAHINGSKAASQKGHRAGMTLLLLNDSQDYAPSRPPGGPAGSPVTPAPSQELWGPPAAWALVHL